VEHFVQQGLFSAEVADMAISERGGFGEKREMSW